MAGFVITVSYRFVIQNVRNKVSGESTGGGHNKSACAGAETLQLLRLTTAIIGMEKFAMGMFVPRGLRFDDRLSSPRVLNLGEILISSHVMSYFLFHFSLW